MGSFVLDKDDNNEDFFPDVNIKVVGVGGGGGNALNCMVTSGIKDVEYIAINTDAAALRSSKATHKVQIGEKLTRGRGAGNKPEIGERSAQENKEEISAALKGAQMVFVAAGMGGGTGTGAAPVVAEIAQEMEILTVAVVTKPFLFEQATKMHQAEKGIEALTKHVDSIIVIPNEKLLMSSEKPLTMKESFAMADDVLMTGVKSIAELITVTGVINLDFADVESTMKNAGYAHMAIGHGSGKDKAVEAANSVITSPLLETSISGATRLLVNIVMSEDVLSADVNTATKLISDAADPSVNMIFGTSFDETMKDEMKITVIAAGFSGNGTNMDEEAAEGEDGEDVLADGDTADSTGSVEIKDPFTAAMSNAGARKPSAQKADKIPTDDYIELLKMFNDR